MFSLSRTNGDGLQRSKSNESGVDDMPNFGAVVQELLVSANVEGRLIHGLEQCSRAFET